MSGGPGGGARLFVALELPEVVRSALVQWAAEAIGEVDGARLLDSGALHMTLCFLGEVELSAIDTIWAAVASEVARGEDEWSPLVFEPDEVRWLPPRRPHVCAVSLRDRDGRAGALQAGLSARLADGGWYAPERRRWLAHVTVARISRDARGRGGRSRGGPRPVGPRPTGPRPTGPRPTGPRPAAEPAPPGLEPFAATAVALMRSWPRSRYEALARVAL